MIFKVAAAQVVKNALKMRDKVQKAPKLLANCSMLSCTLMIDCSSFVTVTEQRWNQTSNESGQVTSQS